MNTYEVRHYSNDTKDGKVYGDIKTTILKNITEVKQEKGLLSFIDNDGKETRILRPYLLSYKKID